MCLPVASLLAERGAAANGDPASAGAAQRVQ